MAIRVREDGTMWCAALTEPEPGDTYIDDTLHHLLHTVHRVIVAWPEPRHSREPQWWWIGSAPSEVLAGYAWVHEGAEW